MESMYDINGGLIQTKAKERSPGRGGGLTPDQEELSPSKRLMGKYNPEKNMHF